MNDERVKRPEQQQEVGRVGKDMNRSQFDYTRRSEEAEASKEVTRLALCVLSVNVCEEGR